MAAPLILIVEDDDQVRSTIGQWIEHYGYRVSLASELSAAERVLRETRPALLIVDVSLPGGTGLRLVELARPRGIPVLLISGSRRISSDWRVVLSRFCTSRSDRRIWNAR